MNTGPTALEVNKCPPTPGGGGGGALVSGHFITMPMIRFHDSDLLGFTQCRGPSEKFDAF